ncbi:MAG: hypothetical protein R2705_12885 [Ilumatobacteraceae bacterium]
MAPADPIVPTDTAVAAEPGKWSAPMLRAYGVPDSLVRQFEQAHASDDTEWIVNFMLGVRHLCGALPERPAVMAGPLSGNLARQLGHPCRSATDLAELHGDAAVAVPNVTASALRTAGRSHSVHVVIGGPWHHLVPVRPDIVSAATEHELLEALRVADAWGATLGWTQVGDRYERIDPYLLAGRIRDLLPDPIAPGANETTDELVR